MRLTFGIVLVLLSLVAWIGQVIAAISPEKAAKLGVTETESAVDPVFAADVRAEAIWDSFVLWTLPAAGVLYVLNVSAWIFFGLVGGGMYLYFAGRGILQRRLMLRREIRIGTPQNVKVAFVFYWLCGISAIVTIVLALKELV